MIFNNKIQITFYINFNKRLILKINFPIIVKLIKLLKVIYYSRNNGNSGTVFVQCIFNKLY